MEIINNYSKICFRLHYVIYLKVYIECYVVYKKKSIYIYIFVVTILKLGYSAVQNKSIMIRTRVVQYNVYIICTRTYIVYIIFLLTVRLYDSGIFMTWKVTVTSYEGRVDVNNKM